MLRVLLSINFEPELAEWDPPEISGESIVALVKKKSGTFSLYWKHMMLRRIADCVWADNHFQA